MSRVQKLAMHVSKSDPNVSRQRSRAHITDPCQRAGNRVLTCIMPMLFRTAALVPYYGLTRKALIRHPRAG